MARDGHADTPRRRAASDLRWRVACGGSAIIGAAIVILSLIPADAMEVDVGGSDKLMHMVAYAALVFPVVAVRPRVALPAVVLAALLGAAIELIQPHFGRMAEWEDALANLLGALLGAGFGAGLHRAVAGAGSGTCPGKGPGKGSGSDHRSGG